MATDLATVAMLARRLAACAEKVDATTSCAERSQAAMVTAESEMNEALRLFSSAKDELASELQKQLGHS